MTDQESLFQKPTFSQDSRLDLTTDQLESVVAAGACLGKIQPTIEKIVRHLYPDEIIHSYPSEITRSYSDRKGKASLKHSSSSDSLLGSGEHKVLRWDSRGNPILHGSSSGSK